MSQLALYRKYRSQSLAEVVGQPHVVKTLSSAVAKGRISHAYLFTGPRGVGKTSIARILAKMVNCEAKEGQPCGKCQNCLAQTHLDIIEIDAASNRSIDEIRELRDKIHSAPSLGKYKVYIIDEVHMLTKEAFNALLKTLEEPPQHAIFVLATTESHKLPATVISRTQRFNFRPHSEAEIAAHLKKVAKSEDIKIDEAAVALLAKAGSGSMRDSLSLLDQMSHFDTKIDAASVRALLGWSDLESLDELLLAIAKGETAGALNLFDRLISQGSPPGQIITQVSARLREILLIGAGVKTAGKDEAAEQLLNRWDITQIAHFIDGLIAIAKSPRPALALESAIAKATSQTPPSRAEQSDPKVEEKIASSPAPRNDEVVISAEEALPEATLVARSTGEPSGKTPKVEKPETTRSVDGATELVPEQAYDLIKQSNHSLFALVKTCDFTIHGDEALISCRFNFHFERLKEAKNREAIEKALDESLGRKVAVRIEHNPTAVPVAPKEAELVSSALEILGGEVVSE